MGQSRRSAQVLKSLLLKDLRGMTIGMISEFWLADCYNKEDPRNRTLKTEYRKAFRLRRFQLTQNPTRD